MLKRDVKLQLTVVVVVPSVRVQPTLDPYAAQGLFITGPCADPGGEESG